MVTNLFISSFKAILFTAVLIPSVHYFGLIYEDAASNNTVNWDNEQRFSQFYATEPNTIDLVFIGSSHAYCSFDPRIFDEILGTHSFNMGMPLQRPDLSYFTLREVLNHHTPERVVMEIYWGMLQDPFDLTQVNMFFDVLENDELRQEIYRSIFPWNELIKYNFNLTRFQPSFFGLQNSNLTEFVEETFDVTRETTQVEGVSFYQERGFIFSDIIIPPDEFDRTNQFKNTDGKDFVIHPRQKVFLRRIIELCRSEGIDLWFVTAPVANVSMDFIQNYHLIYETIADFAASYDIPYLDYNMINKEEHLFENHNFRDDAHLNFSGAVIISNHLAHVLLDSEKPITSYDSNTDEN